MIKATCTDIIKNSKGMITGYVLKEVGTPNNKEYKFNTKDLTNHIKTGNLDIDNLIISENGLELLEDKDKEAVRFMNKTIIMGYSTQEVKVNNINKCYLATRGEDNILFIPSNITKAKLELPNINGNLQIIGGSGLVNVDNMFYNVKADTLDLVLLDTSNIEDMGRMFLGAKIKNIVLGENFFGPKVKNIKYVFRTSTKVNLDLSHVKVSHLNNIDYMFSRAWLGKVKLFPLDGINSAIGLFENTNIDELDLTNWIISDLDNYNYIFKNCYTEKEIKLSQVDRNNKKIMRNKACWTKEERHKHEIELKRKYLEKQGLI